jgi:hypothetical protein
MTSEPRTPRCPYCGFTVFNSRYPKCEKCGEHLPGNMVLSKEELVVVLERERRGREHRRALEGRGSGAISSGLFDIGAVADIGDVADGLLDVFDALPDLDL